MANVQQILQALAASQLQATNAIVDGFRSFHMDTQKQAIPLFSGDMGGQTVHEWLEKADRIAQINTWPPEDCLRIYQERLTKPASNYNDTLTDAQKDTFALWRTNFTNGFNDALVKQDILNQLDDIIQHKSERVRDYVARIDTLYRQAFGAALAEDAAANVETLRNAKKRTVFLNGLNRDIYNLMWYRLPPAAEWADVIEQATNAETILGQKKAMENLHEVNEDFATVSFKSEKLNDRLEQLSQRLDEMLHIAARGRQNELQFNETHKHEL